MRQHAHSLLEHAHMLPVALSPFLLSPYLYCAASGSQAIANRAASSRGEGAATGVRQGGGGGGGGGGSELHAPHSHSHARPGGSSPVLACFHIADFASSPSSFLLFPSVSRAFRSTLFPRPTTKSLFLVVYVCVFVCARLCVCVWVCVMCHDECC